VRQAVAIFLGHDRPTAKQRSFDGAKRNPGAA
jgi:hypothetical protein